MPATRPRPVRIVIDTDGGSDDCAALAYLATNPAVEIVGITTVGGVVSAAQAAGNITGLCRLLGQAAPIAQGHSVADRTKTTLGIYGADGLWGASPGPLPSAFGAAPEALLAWADPETTLLALGPLTNLAAALEEDPERFGSYGAIVVRGGARYGGNITPVAEFNIWQDPRSAARFFAAGLMPTLVSLDYFSNDSFAVDHAAIGQGLAGAWLRPIVARYFEAVHGAELVSAAVGGSAALPRALLPDLVGAVVAANRALVRSQPALALIVEDGLARGQTIIATGMARLRFVASDTELSDLAEAIARDPGRMPVLLEPFIARLKDNIAYVTEIDPALWDEALRLLKAL